MSIQVLVFIIKMVPLLVLPQKETVQKDSTELIKPILIDKLALSGIGLKKVDLKDQPGREFFQKNVFRGKELSVYIVSSQSWTASVADFPIDEYIYMLNGKARVKDATGINRFFSSFDHFFAPKSLTGEWEIMAGDNYHYELSVITTERSATNTVSKDLVPQLLDKDKISGLNVDLGEESSKDEVLISGDELRISLRVEEPDKVQISEPAKEQFLHLLSGQIMIQDSNGDDYTFYSGDFFILPQGFTGKWTSEGHGIVKYLSIEKAW